MVVKLYESDGVKVFNVTADKVLPQWVQKKRGRKLSRDEGYARHIELLQVSSRPQTASGLLYAAIYASHFPTRLELVRSRSSKQPPHLHTTDAAAPSNVTLGNLNVNLDNL